MLPLRVNKYLKKNILHTLCLREMKCKRRKSSIISAVFEVASLLGQQKETLDPTPRIPSIYSRLLANSILKRASSESGLCWTPFTAFSKLLFVLYQRLSEMVACAGKKSLTVTSTARTYANVVPFSLTSVLVVSRYN